MITFDRLRTLKAQCDALVMQNALGFRADTALTKLGALALERIKYERDFISLLNEKQKLRSKVFTGELDADEVKNSDEFKVLAEEERKWWDKEATEFDFVPVTLIIDDIVAEKFGTETKVIPMFGYDIHVPVYSSLHNLINDGFIILTERTV